MEINVVRLYLNTVLTPHRNDRSRCDRPCLFNNNNNNNNNKNTYTKRVCNKIRRSLQSLANKTASEEKINSKIMKIIINEDLIAKNVQDLITVQIVKC